MPALAVRSDHVKGASMVFAKMVVLNEDIDMATKAKGKSVHKKPARKWSGRVTHESNALDLESKVFTYKDPKKIARSLKQSAEKSKRKKTGPFQSAMSMLNFYINRAGKHLSATAKKPLEKAKDELRKLYHKEKQ